jgi:uncharacterized protein YbcI
VKSQGEIEAAVCEAVSRFQQQSLGRGPKDIHCHLLGTLVVVRLQGVLTPAERQLVDEGCPCTEDGEATTNGEHDRDPRSSRGDGRALVKQLRHHVVANGRGRLGRIVEEAVGVRLVSVHHDISTVTGEELLVFSLSEAPECRPPKKRC